MFDIGWQELLIIGLVAIIVIGPKELPRVLRTVTLGIRKLRSMAREFQDGIDELAREVDLQDLRKEIEQDVGTDFQKELESIADPARDLERSAREISGSINAPEPSKSPVVPPDAAEKPALPASGGDRKPGDGV